MSRSLPEKLSTHFSSPSSVPATTFPIIDLEGNAGWVVVGGRATWGPKGDPPFPVAPRVKNVVRSLFSCVSTAILRRILALNASNTKDCTCGTTLLLPPPFHCSEVVRKSLVSFVLVVVVVFIR